MERLTGFDTFLMFMALKNHFTTESYDYIKYKGKLKLTKDKHYLNRRDRFQYEKLARLVSSEDMRDHIIANILKGSVWVGDHLSDDARAERQAFQRRRQSLTYFFKEEVSALLQENKPEKAFRSEDGQYPPVFKALMRGTLSMETFIILNKYIRFTDSLDKNFGKDDVMWGKQYLLISKYTPFLEFDTTKFKELLKEKIQEYS